MKKKSDSRLMSRLDIKPKKKPDSKPKKPDLCIDGQTRSHSNELKNKIIAI